MEVQGIYSPSKMNYAEQRKENEKICGTQKTEEIKEEQTLRLQDAYISSEQSGEKANGLYRIGQDENGNRKIFFEKPGPSRDSDREKESKLHADNQKKPPEICVGNTDQVDREIEQLKEKRKQLKQQMQCAAKEEEIKELEVKLAQVENELSLKDNDAYRRKHTSFQVL